MWGLDIDGDQTVDNQLGQVFATFGSMGFEWAAATTSAVDDSMHPPMVGNIVGGTSRGPGHAVIQMALTGGTHSR